MRTPIVALAARQLLAGFLDEAALAGLTGNPRRDLFDGTASTSFLHLTRPQGLAAGYRTALEAGSDLVVTATAGGHPLGLALPLRDSAFYLNYTAAELACRAVDSLPGGDRRRFVAGLVADGSWLARPADLETATAVQAEGLLAGGADLLLLRPLADPARARALVAGARAAGRRLGLSAPLLVLDQGEGAPLEVELRLQAQPAGGCEQQPASQPTLWCASEPAQLRTADRALRRLAPDGLRPPQPGAAGAWLQEEFTVASSALAGDWPAAASGPPPAPVAFPGRRVGPAQA